MATASKLLASQIVEVGETELVQAGGNRHIDFDIEFKNTFSRTPNVYASISSVQVTEDAGPANVYLVVDDTTISLKGFKCKAMLERDRGRFNSAAIRYTAVLFPDAKRKRRSGKKTVDVKLLTSGLPQP